MSGSDRGDEGFFEDDAGSPADDGAGHTGPAGGGDEALAAGPAGTRPSGEVGDGFAGLPPVKKRRGRPALSDEEKARRRAEREANAAGLSGSLDENAKDIAASREAKAIAETIKARHLMLSLAFGLPMPDEKKIDALAVAWARFQQEYPGTKMSRKMAVVIDLATSVGVTYFPLFAMIMLKAKQAAEARRKPSSGVVRPAPTQNPPHRTDGGTSGSESIRRTTPTGSELVLMSGVVPDKGHLDFGPS